MKANSDVKHAKSQLAAENKKKKALEKSFSTNFCYNVNFYAHVGFHSLYEACMQELRMGGNPLVQGYFGFSRTVGTSEHSLIKI